VRSKFLLFGLIFIGAAVTPKVFGDELMIVEVAFKGKENPKFNFSPSELKKVNLGHLERTVHSCREWEAKEQTPSDGKIRILFHKDELGKAIKFKSVDTKGTMSGLAICLNKVLSFHDTKAPSKTGKLQSFPDFKEISEENRKAK